MKSSTRYYVTRLRAPFLFFMASQTLLRLFLVILEYSNLQWTAGEVIKGFLVGALFDLAVFAYFLVPLTLFLWFSPEGLHGKLKDRWTSGLFFFFLIYLMLFTGVAEWIFWDEFATRFNFIAVDYLVYTQEVIGNIWESYPIVWLLSGIGVIALFFTLQVVKYSRSGYPVPSWRKRAAVFIAAVVLAFASFQSMSGSYAEFGDNRYWQEIARNGYFELFSAFRNNDLSYDKFYIKKDPGEALALTKKEIDGGRARFTDEGITRLVSGDRPEKRHNVIIITVESLSGDYLTAFGNKKNLTPHLDKLADQSMFFTNLYATGTRTVYGLSAITLSIPPVPGNSIVRRPDNGGLFSLGSVLNKKGYISKFIYGGYGYFDNMNAFFENNGYAIVDRTLMEKSQITFANVWGVCDEDLFDATLRESDKTYKEGKPFFNMVMTTSNHRPYTYPEGRIDIPSGKGRSGGVKYTDYAINKLLQDASRKPWFDNTIFVIIADHTASSSGKTSLDPAKYHIPLWIYAPRIIKPQKIDKLASQIDFAPTLLGLMNMSYSSRFYGVDLMKSSPERAFISTYQKLGYMTSDELAILEPVRKISRYRKKGGEMVKQETGAGLLNEKTIAIYQSASRWRELSRDVAADPER